MPAVVRILVIVLVLSGLFVGIGSLRKDQIEGALTLKATAALMDEVPELRTESDWKVSFIGTEGIVHGRIESRQLLENIGLAIEKIEMAEVKGLETVSKLYNGLQFREPASLSISTLNSGAVKLEGTLTAAFVQQLRSALKDALPDHAGIDDCVEVRRELNEIRWGNALLAYLPEFLSEGTGCRLSIDEDRVILGGVVKSLQEKETLGKIAVSHLGSAFSIFENRLGIASDRKPAFATMYYVSPDTLRVSGAVPSEQAKKELLSQIRALASADCKITDELQVDGTLADGLWYSRIPNVMPKLLNYAMTGKVEVDGDAIRVNVNAISERGRREIEQVMTDLFPVGEFQLSSNVKVTDGGVMRVVAAESKNTISTAPKVPISIPSSSLDVGDPKLRQLIEGTVIYFKINSAMLGTESISTLKKVARELAKVSSHGVVLRGFTDPWGNAKLNRELAEFRCRSVRKILKMHGVKEEQVRIEPWSDALIDADKTEPSWKKRRVTMELEPVVGRQLSDAYELRRPELVSAPVATAVIEGAKSEALQESIIYFGTNSYALRRSERTKLRKVVDIFANSPEKEVVISGYCDRWGNPEYNLYLSKKRCETVRSYLIGLGMESGRLVIEENGNRQADNEEGPNWQKRRVEFRLRDPQHLGIL